jgi:hypothetical protein
MAYEININYLIEYELFKLHQAKDSERIAARIDNKYNKWQQNQKIRM